jgi:arylsulfatase A-like enzyme/Flp pilus assembly protein TadD
MSGYQKNNKNAGSRPGNRPAGAPRPGQEAAGKPRAAAILPPEREKAKPRKSRLPLYLGAGAVVVLAGLGAFLFFRNKGMKPYDGNILVITCDTTRADVLTANGGTGNHTPNLDRLAREGVLFKNGMSHVPLTLPSHITLFTGRTPLAHQVRNNGRYALPQQETTLAERLKPAGFSTYAVIASYVLLGRFGLNQGFDEYDDSLDSYKVMNSYNSEITADVVSKRFRGWLAKHKDEKFFAWVHFYDPHEPYAPPKEFLRGPDDEKSAKSRYLGEVEFMDRQIGTILDELKAQGVFGKTLIVVAGDHGEAFGEHVENGHVFFCYEQNIKVPLIFHHETFLPKNRVIDDPVGLTDVMPTLLELCGLERGKELHGQSLVPYLRPKAKSLPRRPFYMETLYGAEENGWAPLTGVVEGGRKFIFLPRSELYDLKADAAETKNLFGEQPAVARHMKDILTSYIASHTEAQSAKRDMTADDVSQLQSLGYLASASKTSRNNMDPKDGVAQQAKLEDFTKTLEKAPGRDLENAVDRYYRDNGLARTQGMYGRVIQIYEQRKMEDKVAELLNKTIAEYPDHVGARMHLLRTYTVQKKFDRVVAVGAQVLELDPINSSARILMGNAYTALGDLDNAFSSLENALKIEPENVSLRLKIAELLIARGKTSEALKSYDALITEEDILKDDEVLHKIALYYAKNDQNRKAADLIERCCRLKPSGNYYFFLGMLLFRIEEYEAALKAMKTALEQYGDELTPQQRAQIEKLVRS